MNRDALQLRAKLAQKNSAANKAESHDELHAVWRARYDDGVMSKREALKILERDGDWMGDQSDSDDDDDDRNAANANDDDATTPASMRVVAPDVRAVFAGMTGGLTDEAIASLTLFLPTEINSADNDFDNVRDNDDTGKEGENLRESVCVCYIKKRSFFVLHTRT